MRTRLFVAAIFAALIATALSVPSAQAGCQRAGYGQVYAQQYVAPVYSYQTVVPYAVPVAVVARDFYSVAPELAQARLLKEVAESSAKKAVEEYIARQQAALATGQVPPVSGQAPVGPSPGAGSVAGKVQLMVNAKCLACHGDDKHGINLTDVTRLTRHERQELVYRIMADPGDKVFMPKPKGGSKGIPVTNDELNTAHAFVAEAANQPARAIEPVPPKPAEPAPPKVPDPVPLPKVPEAIPPAKK